MSATALTPVTIVTGFLGSGKTTLLNRVLGTAHGHRIAVVENEFGEVGIDARILLAEHNERIVELSNGCICCSIRGDLADVLDRLHARRLSGEISFDRVMIETTGLADPGPIAQTFCIDPTLGAHYLLDAVITLIDAKYIEDQLERFPQIAGQIGFADCLLLSKVDLIDQAALDVLQGRIGAMNSRAPIRPTSFGAVPLDDILDLRAFSLGTALRLEGVAPSVEHRMRALEGLLKPFGAIAALSEDASRKLWKGTRDVMPFANDDRALWRISAAPMRAHEVVKAIGAACECFYDWAGGLVWVTLPVMLLSSVAIRVTW